MLTNQNSPITMGSHHQTQVPLGVTYPLDPLKWSSMSASLDHSFNQYSKLMVLRVDLSYTTQAGEITYEQAKADLRRFLSSMRFNQHFDHLFQMAWKLERVTAWHFHTIWFFNGHKVKKDSYYAQMICNRWEEMTQGLGYGYNCNNHPQDYQYYALGLIHREDQSKRQYLDRACAYLCKEDPDTKEQLPKRARTFGRSTIRHS